MSIHRPQSPKLPGFPSIPQSQSGFVLLVGILVVTAIIILSASQFGRVANFVRQGSNKVVQQQAVNLAEAGVDYAIWQLNENAGDWFGPGVEITVGTTGTFFVTVTPESANIKNVVVTGYVPNSISPRQKATVKTQVVIDAETISFNYAVQVGTGGVEMENSATINGTAYSNGNITGSGSSVINGEAWAVGTISSPDPTITLQPPHPNSPPSTMPTVDYQFWKDAATAGGTTNCPNGVCRYDSGSPNLGPQKFIGNLDIAGGAQATMNGPIYVTGNVEIRNSASLKLNENFGSNSTMLIVDGTVDIHNGGTLVPTNSTPKGYIMAVTLSTADPALSVRNRGVNAILYALEGTAEVRNDATVTAIVAKKLIIRNSAILTYDQGLANAQFTTGPGGTWVIRKGSYQYTK